MSALDASAIHDQTDVLHIADIGRGSYRRDIGDIRDLIASIGSLGVLHPVVVTSDLRLLSGRRRLEALKALGETHVTVAIAATQADAVELMQAERNEDFCHKPMSPEELCDLGTELAKLPKVPGRGIREAVADALGMSEGTYNRIRIVVDAARDAEQPEEVQLVAAEMLKGLTRGTVKPATGADRVNSARRQFTAQQIVAQDTRRDNPLLAKTRRINADRVIRESVDAMEGIVSGLALADPALIDPEMAEEWAISLRKSIQAMNRFLREMTRVRE